MLISADRAIENGYNRKAGSHLELQHDADLNLSLLLFLAQTKQSSRKLATEETESTSNLQPSGAPQIKRKRA